VYVVLSKEVVTNNWREQRS